MESGDLNPGMSPPSPPWGLRVIAALLSKLPVGAGQHRLIRPIFERRLKGRGSMPVRTRMSSGAVLDLDLSDYLQAQAYFSRRYDEALVRFIVSRVPRSGTFVDVGAHVGFVALALAVARPHAKVLALEPHPANSARLRANVALNPGASIEVEPVAAGVRAGAARLSSEGEGTDFHRIVDGPEVTGSVEVEVVALDELAERRGLDRIDVLKLDVEGFEPEALSGAEHLLQEGRVGTVICELNDDLLARIGWDGAALEGHLAERGYRREEIPPVGLHRFREPSVAYENFAFSRPLIKKTGRIAD